MPRSPYLIREVDGARHAAVIDGLDGRFFKGAEEEDPRRGHWWIVFMDGEPVGYAGLRPLSAEPGAFLCRSGVLPEHRGHGLQRRLIRARIRKARRLGLQYLLTYTINNPKSANNLIDCGFRMYAPARKWGGSDASYWSLTIQ